MREVVKTNVKRKESSKRTRRRRRNMPLYVFLVFLLVLAIGATLSMTLFFNIKNITVSGESDYSNDEIIRVSGIQNGDNLVRLDASGAEKRILASMIYIENVDISKRYPDSISINVEKSTASACLKSGSGFLFVSAKGRILDKAETADSTLLRINGFEPSNENLGTTLESSDPQKDEIVLELLEAILGREEQRVKSVDMTDKYDIKVNFEDRIIFEMGNSNDIAYKLDLANTVLDEINPSKTGTMKMVGTNQVSFRAGSNNLLENPDRIPVSKNDLPSAGEKPPGVQEEKPEELPGISIADDPDIVREHEERNNNDSDEGGGEEEYNAPDDEYYGDEDDDYYEDEEYYGYE